MQEEHAESAANASGGSAELGRLPLADIHSTSTSSSSGCDSLCARRWRLATAAFTLISSISLSLFLSGSGRVSVTRPSRLTGAYLASAHNEEKGKLFSLSSQNQIQMGFSKLRTSTGLDGEMGNDLGSARTGWENGEPPIDK